MAAKMGLVVKLAVLVLLLAAVSATARSVDLFDLLASNNPEAFQLAAPAEDCCKSCECTKSNPPQCRCNDVFVGEERCKGCKLCPCTRSKPPQCTCLDVRTYCLPKCKSAPTTAGSAEAAGTTTVAFEMISLN